jgi:hypothetical protein
MHSRALRARREHEVPTDRARKRRFVMPATRLHVRPLAHAVRAFSRGTLHAQRILESVERDAAVEHGAERGVFRADHGVAVDVAHVVPERVLGGLEIVLDLQNAGWCLLVAWQIANFEGHASTKHFGVQQGVNEAPASGNMVSVGVCMGTGVRTNVVSRAAPYMNV